MTQTIIELWNGNIAPYEHCGSQDAEARHLANLRERSRESLYEGLTEMQKEAFRKYIGCTEDYLLRMLELAFCDGFCLGSKLAAEALV